MKLEFNKYSYILIFNEQRDNITDIVNYNVFTKNFQNVFYISDFKNKNRFAHSFHKYEEKFNLNINNIHELKEHRKYNVLLDCNELFKLPDGIITKKDIILFNPIEILFSINSNLTHITEKYINAVRYCDKFNFCGISHNYNIIPNLKNLKSEYYNEIINPKNINKINIIKL